MNLKSLHFWWPILAAICGVIVAGVRADTTYSTYGEKLERLEIHDRESAIDRAAQKQALSDIHRSLQRIEDRLDVALTK